MPSNMSTRKDHPNAVVIHLSFVHLGKHRDKHVLFKPGAIHYLFLLIACLLVLA